MSPSTEAALLRRVAEGRETDDDRLVLADRLRTYLASAAGGTTLDGVFGLARSAGGLPWWRVEALDRRDAALRALAARFYAGRTIAAQAVAINAALLHYATTAWRFDSRETAPPARCFGTEREMMFDALSACDSVPSARHLRRVLRP